MHFHETILTQVEKKKEKEKNENSRKEIMREKKNKETKQRKRKNSALLPFCIRSKDHLIPFLIGFQHYATLLHLIFTYH